MSKINTRITQKCDTSVNWEKATNFTPFKGEIIVYTDLNQFKIGDGETNVRDLPFSNAVIPGETENSAILAGEYEGYSNKAISPVSMALGAGSAAGLKGWYYTKYNPDKRLIWLSDTRTTSSLLGVTRIKISETTSETPDDSTWVSGWNKDDQVTIVNGNYKYERCAEIEDVKGNMIKLKAWPTFTDWQTSAISLGSGNFELDEFSITAIKVTDDSNTKLRTVSSYDKGGVDFGAGSHAEGIQTAAVNLGAHAEGIQTIAYGQYAHAEGFKTEAGYSAHAEGKETIAAGEKAHAEGMLTRALGLTSHAEGHEAVAEGNYSHAEGFKTKAAGEYAHVEGFRTQANGSRSHAEGDIETAEAPYNREVVYIDGDVEVTKVNTGFAEGHFSHREGRNTSTFGNGAHAEGNGSMAIGNSSHAEGYKTTAIFGTAHSEGYETRAEGIGAHAEGRVTTAKGECAHAEGKNTIAQGECAHVEGKDIQALAPYAHAEGGLLTSEAATYNRKINDADGIERANDGFAHGEYSHREGRNTSTYGNYSHAEGSGAMALGNASHAEGYNTTAIHTGAHAEGYYSTAAGKYSHAEGYEAQATGENSHAEGKLTMAAGDYSHAEGCINRSDRSTYGRTVTYDWGTTTVTVTNDGVAHGPSSHREGNNTYTQDTASHAEGDGTMAIGLTSHSEGNLTTAIGQCSHAEGNRTTASGSYSHAEGFCIQAIGDRSHAEGDVEEGDTSTYNRIVEYTDTAGNLVAKTSNGFANGAFSHREGRNTATFGNGSHAEGQGSMTVGSAAHAEGYNTTAVHTGAHSEGSTTHAEGEGAHTEGRLTVAKGVGAHAEGSSTHAEGEGAHAEGYDTWAKMACAHAEGKGTRAEAKYSHAAGLYTVATIEAQTVVGSYNLQDSTAKFVVGAGIKDNNANAFTAGNDGVDDYITIGEEKLTESELKTIKAGGSSTGSVEWASLQNKPNIHVANGGGVKIGDAPGYPVVRTSETSLVVGAYDSYTGASGAHSVAFGDSDDATAFAGTIANGDNSIAGGLTAIAEYDQSQAFGYGVKTGRTEQMVIGKYNEIDENAYFVVGDGDITQVNWYEGDLRKGSRNCFTVGNDGTEDYITLGLEKLTATELNKIKSGIISEQIKTEIVNELKAYIDEMILGGKW